MKTFDIPQCGKRGLTVVFISAHQMVNGFTDVPRRFSAIVLASA